MDNKKSKKTTKYGKKNLEEVKAENFTKPIKNQQKYTFEDETYKKPVLKRKNKKDNMLISNDNKLFNEEVLLQRTQLVNDEAVQPEEIIAMDKQLESDARQQVVYNMTQMLNMLVEKYELIGKTSGYVIPSIE